MARYSNGYVRLYRSAVDGDIGMNGNLLALWVVLLSWANWQDRKILFNGEMRELPPGHVILGYRELAEKWDVSKNTIMKWMKYLERTGRIRLESSTRGTLVTICKWSQYQGDESSVEDTEGRQEDAKRTPSVRGLGQQVTLNEESKNLRREESECPAVERERSPCGAIGELLGDADVENALVEVTQRTQALWLKTYHDAEWIKRELLKALTWLEANPRKKSKSFTRFMGNWLSRGWEQHRKTLPSNQAQPEFDIDKILAKRGAA